METSSQVFEFFLQPAVDFDEEWRPDDLEDTSSELLPKYASFYDIYQAYLRRHH
jgi:hypothetical protein